MKTEGEARSRKKLVLPVALAVTVLGLTVALASCGDDGPPAHADARACDAACPPDAPFV